jgi:MoaA/NifB/PqqE/SkfB family radical SAM enzyme
MELSLSRLKYLKYIRVSLFDYARADHWKERRRLSPATIRIQNETGRHIEGEQDGYLSVNNEGTAKYCTMPENFVTESWCRAPFSFNTLNTDGSLVTCITFWEVGNVFESPFWRLWNNKRMRLIRNKALSMAIPRKYADCRNCGYFMRLPKYQQMNRYE